MYENLEKAYEFYVQKTGKNITIEEFLDEIENNIKNFNQATRYIESISENSLDKAVGGKNTAKKDMAILISVLSIMMPDGDFKNLSNKKSFSNFFSVVNAVKFKGGTYINGEDDIVNYICDEKISEVEEKIAKIIKKYNNKCLGTYVSSIEDVSSYRHVGENKNNLTEIEKILDNAVRNNDLPIKSFTVKVIDDLKLKYKPDYTIFPRYIIVRNDCNAIDLQFNCKDCAIVQIASQFNALESVNEYFSPVKDWFIDKTQGPMAALQSVSACKHRESAALLGKLPDSINHIVDNFIVKQRCGFLNLFSKNIKITDKYQYLYKGGYLNLYEIKDLKDLTKFAEHIKKNKNNIKINAQWVRCEKTGYKQFQVFCAAPSFQGKSNIDWNDKNDIRISLFKSICKDLVVEQYKAIAQIAAIKSVLSRKNVELHLYQVGQGAFYNPEEVMPLALEAVIKELKGYNVCVYLHNGYRNRNRTWDDILNLKYNGNSKLIDFLGNIEYIS